MKSERSFVVTVLLFYLWLYLMLLHPVGEELLVGLGLQLIGTEIILFLKRGF